MGYKVKLNVFEGPFDLLVYLIENARMSIYDINVSEITDQYLRYIDEMKSMDINVATEFMVLAASLIEIKSKMLLPRTGDDGDMLEQDDPRTELVEKLLEYKRFKAAAEMLAESEEYESHIYEKPQEDISGYTNQPDEYLKMDLVQFMNAFSLFIKRKQRIEDVKKRYTRIERQRITVEEKIAHIRAFFTRGKRTNVTFRELTEDDKDRYSIVTTFTSLLEMAKARAVGLAQKTNFGEIVVTKGEAFDTADAAQMAESQIKEAASGGE